MTYITGSSPNRVDGLSFTRAVREAVHLGKEVLLYKAGRTQEGKTATSGHTASKEDRVGISEMTEGQSGRTQERLE